MGVRFEVHHNSTVYNNHEETFVGSIDTRERVIYKRGGPNSAMDAVRGIRAPSWHQHCVGHYRESDDSVQVYHNREEENEHFLIGHVNKAGEIFNKSGRLLGSVDEEGRIYDAKKCLQGRVRLTNECVEKPSSDLLKKMGGVAGLRLILSS